MLRENNTKDKSGSCGSKNNEECTKISDGRNV